MGAGVGVVFIVVFASGFVAVLSLLLLSPPPPPTLSYIFLYVFGSAACYGFVSSFHPARCRGTTGRLHAGLRRMAA
jgi:hypothetical protein